MSCLYTLSCWHKCCLPCPWPYLEEVFWQMEHTRSSHLFNGQRLPPQRQTLSRHLPRYFDDWFIYWPYSNSVLYTPPPSLPVKSVTKSRKVTFFLIVSHLVTPCDMYQLWWWVCPSLCASKQKQTVQLGLYVWRSHWANGVELPCCFTGKELG